MLIRDSMRARATTWMGAFLLLSACEHPAETAAGPVAPKGEVWLSTDQVQRAQIRVEVAERKPIAQTLVTGGKIVFDDLLVSHVF